MGPSKASLDDMTGVHPTLQGDAANTCHTSAVPSATVHLGMTWTSPAVEPTSTWAKPSPRMWKMRKAELSLAAGAALVAGVASGAASGSTAGVIGTVVGVIGLATTLFWLALRRYRAWAYQEREDDLMVVRGVMFRRLSVVPYGRMQFVDVTSGPAERIFKLATVKLHTAAAASDARIPGLEREEAARLRDRLAELGEARAAGL